MPVATRSSVPSGAASLPSTLPTTSAPPRAATAAAVDAAAADGQAGVQPVLPPPAPLPPPPPLVPVAPTSAVGQPLLVPMSDGVEDSFWPRVSRAGSTEGVRLTALLRDVLAVEASDWDHAARLVDALIVLVAGCPQLPGNVANLGLAPQARERCLAVLLGAHTRLLASGSVAPSTEFVGQLTSAELRACALHPTDVVFAAGGPAHLATSLSWFDHSDWGVALALTGLSTCALPLERYSALDKLLVHFGAVQGDEGRATDQVREAAANLTGNQLYIHWQTGPEGLISELRWHASAVSDPARLQARLRTAVGRMPDLAAFLTPPPRGDAFAIALRELRAALDGGVSTQLPFSSADLRRLNGALRALAYEARADVPLAERTKLVSTAAAQLRTAPTPAHAARAAARARLAANISEPGLEPPIILRALLASRDEGILGILAGASPPRQLDTVDKYAVGAQPIVDEYYRQQLALAHPHLWGFRQAPPVPGLGRLLLLGKLPDSMSAFSRIVSPFCPTPCTTATEAEFFDSAYTTRIAAMSRMLDPLLFEVGIHGFSALAEASTAFFNAHADMHAEVLQSLSCLWSTCLRGLAAAVASRQALGDEAPVRELSLTTYAGDILLRGAAMANGAREHDSFARKRALSSAVASGTQPAAEPSHAAPAGQPESEAGAKRKRGKNSGGASKQQALSAAGAASQAASGALVQHTPPSTALVPFKPAQSDRRGKGLLPARGKMQYQVTPNVITFAGQRYDRQRLQSHFTEDVGTMCPANFVVLSTMSPYSAESQRMHHCACPDAHAVDGPEHGKAMATWNIASRLACRVVPPAPAEQPFGRPTPQ